MKIKHTINGDMILSNRSWGWFVLLVLLLLANIIAGGHAMATTRISSWGPNIYIQLPLLAILGFFLGRAFTRKSEFYFDSKNKTVHYLVQSLWSEDKGIIQISNINGVVIQQRGTSDSGDPLKRLVINCKNKEIPFSVTYTNVNNFEKDKKVIDEWLKINNVA